jgi:hypothetical protein
MSSKRKIEANRRNARRSTGPKTAEGKSASSRNALRHGLSSERLAVLPGESQDDLDALIEAIHDELQPKTDTERHFVDRMIAARWKLARLQRWEAAAFDAILEREDGAGDPDRRMIHELKDPTSMLHKIERYTAAAERAYSKALKDLMQYRAQTLKLAQQNKAKSPRDWFQSEMAKLQNEPTDPWDDPTIAPPQPMIPPYNPPTEPPTCPKTNS